ncbi:MAG: hypothetical protein J6U66_04310, partial [Lachnospiraceae bacterium]|nr:hypothetical protein [Lachnospiraceae bacterium]
MRKFGKRFNLVLAGALLAVSTLGACGVQGSIADQNSSSQASGNAQVSQTGNTNEANANNNAQEPQTAEKKELVPLSVSYPAGNIRVTVNILALQKGYFAAEGVTVNPVAIGGNDALTAINEDNGALDVL